MNGQKPSDRPSEPGWDVDYTSERLQQAIDSLAPSTPHDRRVIDLDRYPGEPVEGDDR